MCHLSFYFLLSSEDTALIKFIYPYFTPQIFGNCPHFTPILYSNFNQAVKYILDFLGYIFFIRLHVYSICYGNEGASSSVGDVDRDVIIRNVLDPISGIVAVFMRRQEEIRTYLHNTFLQ
jgi:hypothetical protein